MRNMTGMSARARCAEFDATYRQRKTITTIVFKAPLTEVMDPYGDRQLDSVIDLLKSVRLEIPKAYRRQCRVAVVNGLLKVWYDRLETKAERKARIKGLMQWARKEIEKEREAKKKAREVVKIPKFVRPPSLR